MIVLTAHEKRLKMPPAIERNVLKQNVEFMHVRSHFSPEYFQFVKRLVAANHNSMPSEVSVEASVITFNIEYSEHYSVVLVLVFRYCMDLFLFYIG